MKKYITLILTVILMLSATVFTSTVEAASTKSHAVKDRDMEKLTFYVKTVKQKKVDGNKYSSYKFATKYPSQKKRELKTKLISPYLIDGDDSCAAGSNHKAVVLNEKSSPSIVYFMREDCGWPYVSSVYTIKDGDLKKAKVPAEFSVASIKFTGKDKLQGNYYNYVLDKTTIYNFKLDRKKNALKLVNSYVK